MWYSSGTISLFRPRPRHLAKKISAATPASSSTAPSPAVAVVTLDFEATLGEIEVVVRKLESGELSLDDSLRQYESAVSKMRRCYELLDVAERRVSVLAGFDADGNPVTEPLEDAGDGRGNDAETLIEKQKTRSRRRGAVLGETFGSGAEMSDES